MLLCVDVFDQPSYHLISCVHWELKEVELTALTCNYVAGGVIHSPSLWLFSF